MKGLASLVLAATALALAAPGPPGEHLAHGLFADVTLRRPASQVQRVVVLVADPDGDPQAEALAAQLADDGALVAEMSLPTFDAAAVAGGGDAPVGQLVNLSHFLQAYVHAPGYRLPILVGLGAAAGRLDNVLETAPSNTFAGLVTARCPVATGRHSSAEQRTLDLGAAGCRWWQGRPGTEPSLARFAGQVASIAAEAPTTTLPPDALADLPLVEAPVSGSGPTFAVFVSGDGGWAGLDQAVAEALTRRGVPVVGFDSLRYFWSPRTPAGFAADLERVIGFYEQSWHRDRVVLIGYSQGADVLPFAVNRISPASRADIDRLVLIGPGPTAAFEFHLATWAGFDPQGLPILPELKRLAPAPVLCLYGDDDENSLCPGAPPGIIVRSLPGGHHFDGDYQRLAATLLTPLPR